MSKNLAAINGAVEQVFYLNGSAVKLNFDKPENVISCRLYWLSSTLETEEQILLKDGELQLQDYMSKMKLSQHKQIELRCEIHLMDETSLKFSLENQTHLLQELVEIRDHTTWHVVRFGAAVTIKIEAIINPTVNIVVRRNKELSCVYHKRYDPKRTTIRDLKQYISQETSESILPSSQHFFDAMKPSLDDYELLDGELIKDCVTAGCLYVKEYTSTKLFVIKSDGTRFDRLKVLMNANEECSSLKQEISKATGIPLENQILIGYTEYWTSYGRDRLEVGDDWPLFLFEENLTLIIYKPQPTYPEPTEKTKL